jgi:hypothetical protein
MKHFLILAFMGAAFGVLAQPAVERQVTASQGSSDASGRIRLDWTLGEPAITTLQTPSGLLTQGFQQPAIWVELLPILPTPPRMAADIRVAPNPAATEINIFFPADISGAIWLEFSDMQGRPILREKTDTADSWRMDVSAYPRGAYLLRCVDVDGQVLSVHRIIKTQ